MSISASLSPCLSMLSRILPVSCFVASLVPPNLMYTTHLSGRTHRRESGLETPSKFPDPRIPRDLSCRATEGPHGHLIRNH